MSDLLAIILMVVAAYVFAFIGGGPSMSGRTFYSGFRSYTFVAFLLIAFWVVSFVIFEVIGWKIALLIACAAIFPVSLWIHHRAERKKNGGGE